MQVMTSSGKETSLRLPLLIAGAIAGLLIAATGMLERIDLQAPLPPGNIARVGDTLIPTSRYTALLEDLRADKRNPLTDEDRAFAVDRLIDEELLIQRGVELGMASDAPAVRKAIASAVIAQIVADASTTLPGEEELREFYQSSKAFFSRPEGLIVRWWKLRGPQVDAVQAAGDLVTQARSVADFAPLFEREGLEAVRELPYVPLPPSKLLDYLGPVLLERAISLDQGEFSAPVYSDGAVHVLYLVQREPGSTPAFESIRDVVAREYIYRAGDRALQENLDRLREQTPVQIGNPGP
jgi:hypothetical protein